MRRHLNARCKDLLEVNFDPEETGCLVYKVYFLHRTVRDFLNNRDMHDFLAARTCPEFDPNSSISRVLLAQLKAYPVKSKSGHYVEVNEIVRQKRGSGLWGWVGGNRQRGYHTNNL